ncbi:MAG TPA: transketolase [Aestuariivirgaceae bacterium]|nr:transketolase [Aestuariivirgaceae bacterium]
MSTVHDMANAIRALAMDAVEKANSGHPGLPMGAADFATVLFTRFLKFDAAAPHWPDRDRFVLSAGHGSMLLYALLYLTGYADMTLEDIKNFRQLGSRTAGHPEYGHSSGIETTTGPLGQGFANAVGMAIAERHLAAVFGSDLVNHHTYALVGDGCLMEGISQEALTLAGHLKLAKLIVLFDDNGVSIDGPVTLADSTDQPARFAASGWAVARVDGHDPEAVTGEIAKAQDSDRPTLIACRTIIGFGAPKKQGTAAVHGSPLGAAELAAARERLGWRHPPFEIPTELLEAWRAVGRRSAGERQAWERRLAAVDPAVRAEFQRRMRGDLPPALAPALRAYIEGVVSDPPALATRNASQNALDVINAAVPETIGGSADLTGSNNTRSKDMKPLTVNDYGGRYIHWGIREHAMAAGMNGLFLHGGVRPYGGSFLTFTDYCRPSIRLAALMGIGVIFVMTHDSIGLGEDGPTHQPIEHLAALRAIPNLLVLRPCDAVETAEIWEVALNERHRPSVMALSRQKLKPNRLSGAPENLSARGAYVIAGGAVADVVIFASGSEVEIAAAARQLLEADGIGTRVVSVPSMELFARQSDEYRASVLGKERVRGAIEAGVRMGWDPFIGTDGVFVGMSGFGASGPYDKVYAHFGITAEAAAARLKARFEAQRDGQFQDT